MGLKSLAVLMVIVACWWLIRRWSQPQSPSTQGKRNNLNRRVSDLVTPAPGNTLRPHDLELRRLQGESQALTKELEAANNQITNLHKQLLVASGNQAAKPAEITESDSSAANPRPKEPFADPENA